MAELPFAAGKLIEVATKTITYTFRNNESSAPYQLLKNFLDQKNFADIETQLRLDEGYKKKTSNHILIPGTEDYNTYISKLVKQPYSWQAFVTRNGSPFNIDEAVH